MIGGGCASIAAAWELTKPDWHHKAQPQTEIGLPGHRSVPRVAADGNLYLHTEVDQRGGQVREDQALKQSIAAGQDQRAHGNQNAPKQTLACCPGGQQAGASAGKG